MRRLRNRSILSLAWLFAALVVLALPAGAQVLYGTLVGNVTDSSGGAVPGATVTLINTATNLAREATTNAEGVYRFVNVQPGSYKVRVVLSGFKEYVRDGVPISSTTVTRVDVALEVGALTESITVQSETSLLQTDTGDVHSQLNGKEVTTLPLGNYRNYQSLVNLVPGATPAVFQNAVTDTPERALSTNVNGTARNSNNTKLDGATNIFVWLPHHAVYIAPAETVDTVNVTTASFDAEQGMAGGASVTVLTKSGTNEFHGSGFYFMENAGLRARNWANTSGDKPDSKRNIGGATIGGPIIKNKLFFFGSWEGHYTTSPDTGTFTVPTEAMRAGDFSAFGTTIYDPATGNADGSGRTPFANNVIPGNRISPIAQALQTRMPLPNAPGTSGNYTTSGTTKFNRNNYDAKLNYNISSAAQIFAKYSQMSATVSADSFFGDPATGGAGGYGFGGGLGGSADTTVKIGTVGLTWTLSPRRRPRHRLRHDAVRPVEHPAGLRHELRHGRLRDPGHERRGRRQRRHPLLGDADHLHQWLRLLRWRRRLGSGLPERPQLQLLRQPDLHDDEPRAEVRRRRGPDGAEPLAAGAGLLASRLLRVLRRCHRAGAERLARPVQLLRRVPARPGGHRVEEPFSTRR